MTAETPLQEIPQRPSKPLIGNALTVDAERMIQSLMELAEEHGPIFQLRLLELEMEA